MSVEARSVGPGITAEPRDCAGCGGDKGAPLVGVVSVHRPHSGLGLSIALCEECGRDLANAVGFLCVRDGGWSKIEPRKRRAAR
jgi:hypothetical protein